MNKKIIAYFTTSSTNLGVFNQLVELAINIDRTSFTPIFILSNDIVENHLITKLKDNNIKVLSLKSNRYYYFFQLFKLIKILKNNNVHIVHTRLRRCDFYANLSKFFYRVIVVNHIVDDHLDHFNTFHKHLSKFLGVVYKIVSNFADAIIANSRENFIFHKKVNSNTYFLNNGIDTDYYRRNEINRNQLLVKHSISENALNVGFVGEFKKIKGIDLLIEIIKEFKNHKNINFIICAGGDYLRAEFDNEFNDYNNVFNLGFVTNLNEYYSLFDLQIYTSLSEGMQNVMLESFSSGNPAICPDAPGYSSLVDCNKGFLVERVKDAYVKKLYLLESNPNILKEMSFKCRREMENEHNFIKLSKKLETIYNSLI
ncbi:glycosyltransferase [Candidatus Marinimicrobia bacterium]|nr:glycosyltransferase [Candidatus Neomarinimicrobiota bacterium]|tara:strand:- start:3636 stop:4745 length:1110 start_codon:yes stop_codon:yes gene_type:complete